MRLEYFQMIDRFVALDVGGRVARAVCTVPKAEHRCSKAIFRAIR